jgi:FkbM family methyltransferase
LYYRLHQASLLPGISSGVLEFAPGVELQLFRADPMHQCIGHTGFYELRVTRQICHLAAEGGLLVDVGANIGYYSCLWAAEQGSNTVVAVEAAPSNADVLQENVQRNSFESQVRVLESAVGKEESTVLFEPGNESASGQGSLSIRDREHAISITQTTLDHIVGGKDFIEVLKIDIEGADTWALEGANQLLQSRRIGHIFYEQEPSRMEKLGIHPGRAQELLNSNGYQVERIGSNEYHATAK